MMSLGSVVIWRSISEGILMQKNDIAKFVQKQMQTE